MTPAPVELRPARPSDEADLRACVHDAYGRYLDRMDRRPAPMLDDYASLISRGVVHVATADDALVGLIVMWANDDHLYVDNVAVSPAAQGTGVAGRLLAHAEDVARRLGLSEIRLYTNEAMTENLAYYPKRGFVETHRQLDDGYRRVFFTRTLPPLD